MILYKLPRSRSRIKEAIVDIVIVKIAILEYGKNDITIMENIKEIS